MNIQIFFVSSDFLHGSKSKSIPETPRIHLDGREKNKFSKANDYELLVQVNSILNTFFN
jgi:hypothetical protein